MSILAPYRGARMYFDPLNGNHGDRLIRMGAEICLNQFGFEWVDDPNRAELIVINGGGALLTDLWLYGQKATNPRITRLDPYCTDYAKTPLVILPSSYHWSSPSPLPHQLATRVAPTVIFARSHASLERLKRVPLPSGVKVLLDHDMAFHLIGSPFLRDLEQKSSTDHVLVVERFDRERDGEVEPEKEGFDLRQVAHLLPGPLQRLGRSALDVWRKGRSNAWRSMLDKAIEIDPALAAKPVVYGDISIDTRYSFEDFVSLIASAQAVVSMRLHPAILGAMLGKPTFLQGLDHSYNKIQASFATSLASCPTAHLLTDIPVTEMAASRSGEIVVNQLAD